jgi:hypothetical protein
MKKSNNISVKNKLKPNPDTTYSIMLLDRIENFFNIKIQKGSCENFP